MEVVDIEPTWMEICRWVSAERIHASELEPACKIADLVRQAQKKGAISVTFTFDGNGIADFEELYSPTKE